MEKRPIWKRNFPPIQSRNSFRKKSNPKKSVGICKNSRVFTPYFGFYSMLYFKHLHCYFCVFLAFLRYMECIYCSDVYRKVVRYTHKISKWLRKRLEGCELRTRTHMIIMLPYTRTKLLVTQLPSNDCVVLLDWV